MAAFKISWGRKLSKGITISEDTHENIINGYNRSSTERKQSLISKRGRGNVLV